MIRGLTGVAWYGGKILARKAWRLLADERGGAW